LILVAVFIEDAASVFEHVNEWSKKHQGVMIPKGAYYRYHNTGKENLVVIRVGAGVKGRSRAGGNARRPDGKPLIASSEENRPCHPSKTRDFFADSAG